MSRTIPGRAACLCAAMVGWLLMMAFPVPTRATEVTPDAQLSVHPKARFPWALNRLLKSPSQSARSHAHSLSLDVIPTYV